MNKEGFIPPHGNYRELPSYQKTEVVYDSTFRFCQKFPVKGDRTIDQMFQAARSGKQNILEGSQAYGASKETEIKLGCRPNLTYQDFRKFVESCPPETIANIAIRLIHQANYPLDQQKRRLEKDFLKEGGLRERMTRARLEFRKKAQR